MERDITNITRLLISVISTHTLTWSVTLTVPNVKGDRLISTHTLTWSVTQSCRFHLSAKRISTHTLTWSVTWRRALKTYGQVHFNSHAHVERDYWFRRLFPRSAYFNSHAHVERDLKATETPYIQHISTHTLTWSVTGRKMRF